MTSGLVSSRVDKEKRIRSILAFSSDLHERLTQDGRRALDGLSSELERKIAQFPHKLFSAASSHFEALDSHGTTLWNTCIRLKRTADETSISSQSGNVIAMSRVYAFFMLDCAHNGGKGTSANLLRLMKVALKTAKNCLEMKQTDLAIKVLEKASNYNDELKQGQATKPSEIGGIISSLNSEYFILRTVMAWRQDRLDVADQMFRKAFNSDQALNADTAESLADAVFEMGADMLAKKQYDIAAKWLERAYNVLTAQELERLSVDATELRIGIMQSLIRTLILLEDTQAMEKAQKLVELLSRDFGDKLVVLLLRLEILSASANEVFDSNAYGDILHRMARTVVLTDSNMELLLFHVQKLYEKSPSTACRVLDDFLHSRLASDNEGQHLEKALVMRLWMASRQRESPELVQAINELFDTLKSRTAVMVGASATSLAQTLFWKRIEANYTQGEIEAAEAWCRLALHPILDKSNEMNIAKLQRKLLICALARNDVVTGREVFDKMGEAARNHPTTQFILYKLALRAKDKDMAKSCLEKISKDPKKDGLLLQACVLDAQQLGENDCTIEALHRVLEMHDHRSSTNIHLPALLRTTIRLLMTELDKSIKIGKTASIRALVSQIAKVFSAASSNAQKQNSFTSVPQSFTVEELDWFSKNAYNLAITHCTDWESRVTLDILHSCIHLIELYPKDIGNSVSMDVGLRSMFCSFLAAVLQVATARTEDNVERQLQDYLEIRKNVDRYDLRFTELQALFDEAQRSDLLKKLSVLYAYNFEAAIRLKTWDELNRLIEKATICKSMRLFEVFGDCILSSEAPLHVIVNTLKKIVNEAWNLDEFNIVKLSRYMRCLFQFSQSSDEKTAKTLLDQVHDFAQEASGTEHPYPSDELEWVATTAFNHAVDLYCSGDDAGCKEWASKALNISSLIPDNSALQKVLEQNFMGLNWEL